MRKTVNVCNYIPQTKHITQITCDKCGDKILKPFFKVHYIDEDRYGAEYKNDKDICSTCLPKFLDNISQTIIKY